MHNLLVRLLAGRPKATFATISLFLACQPELEFLRLQMKKAKHLSRNKASFTYSQGKFSSEEYTKFQDRLDTNGKTKTQFAQAVQRLSP